MPYSVLMPIFADSILHSGPKGLGLLMAASGLGSLCGALALVSRQRRPRSRTMGGDLDGRLRRLALIVFSLSRTFWLSAALLVPVGAAMIVEMASSNTLIQAMVPNALRGRVMAVYSMMFMGMAPFGALFAGWLAERIGAPRTVALGGAICIIASAIFSQRLPTLRDEGRALILAQELSGGGLP